MVVVGDVAVWAADELVCAYSFLSARIHRVTVPRAAPLNTVGIKKYMEAWSVDYLISLDLLSLNFSYQLSGFSTFRF